MTYEFSNSPSELTLELFNQLVDDLAKNNNKEYVLWVSREIKEKLNLGDYFREYKIVTTPNEQ